MDPPKNRPIFNTISDQILVTRMLKKRFKNGFEPPEKLDLFLIRFLTKLPLLDLLKEALNALSENTVKSD